MANLSYFQKVTKHWAVVLVGVAAVALVVGSARADDSPMTGVWKPKELQFSYVGMTTFYSCSGIEAKLATILSQLGAAPKPIIFGYCDSGTGYPSRIGGAHLKFSVLEPGSKADQAIFGHWQKVTFERNPRLNLDDGDCELFEQLSKTLIPLFSVRIIEAKFSCVPRDITSYSYKLELEVFMPIDERRGVMR